MKTSPLQARLRRKGRRPIQALCRVIAAICDKAVKIDIAAQVVALVIAAIQVNVCEQQAGFTLNVRGFKHLTHPAAGGHSLPCRPPANDKALLHQSAQQRLQRH